MLRGRWDIDDEMNELMMRFHIDRHNPAFQRCLQANRIFLQNYEKLQVATDEVVLVSERSENVAFFSETLKRTPIHLQITIAESVSQIKEITKDTAIYLVCSFDYRGELTARLADAGRRVIDLYDCFEDAGLIFEQDYFKVFPGGYYKDNENIPSNDYLKFDLNAVFFWHRRRYEVAEGRLKKVLLEKMIFDCAFARDFVTLVECIEQYQQEYQETSIEYVKFLKEVQGLLDRIRTELGTRQQEHCIVYWLDQLEHENEADMPFLKQMDEQTLNFERMYTVTPYTQPTIKVLFSKNRVIEEESFKQKTVGMENSSFFNGLQERGYQFKYYGSFSDYFEEPFSDRKNIVTRYTPVSNIFWNALRDLVLCSHEEKCFFVLHEFMQTHNPCFSFGMRGKTYGCILEKGVQNADAAQRKESGAYVDRLLKLYFELFPKNFYQIFMSDHGYNMVERFHVIFKIFQKNISPRKVSSILSYYDFDKVIYSVLDRQGVDVESLSTGSAFVEDLDIYNKEYIIKQIKAKKLWHDMSSYKGIITERDMLLCYRSGFERYHLLNGEEQSTEEPEKRKQELRKHLDLCWVDIENEEQFKYSRIVAKVLFEKYYRPNKIREVIQCTLQQLFQKGRVAIRGGGYHTLRLLNCLSEEDRKKIYCIIDKNKNCDIAPDIPVITPEELAECAVDAVLLSSWVHRETYKAEMEQLCTHREIEIVDLYDRFEEAGIVCEDEFFRQKDIWQRAMEQIEQAE